MAPKRKEPAAVAEVAAVKQKRQRRTVPKDPNAPKHPLSAFMLFSNEHRTKVKAAKPELSFQQTGIELGQMWAKLPDSKKEKYRVEAEKRKAAYKEAKAKYTPPPEIIAAKAAAKAKKDPAAAPQSAMHVFATEKELEIRAQLADPSDIAAFAAAVAARWEALADADKAKYSALLTHGGKVPKISASKRARAIKKAAELNAKKAKLLAKLHELDAELGKHNQTVGLSGGAPTGTEAALAAVPKAKAPAHTASGLTASGKKRGRPSKADIAARAAAAAAAAGGSAAGPSTALVAAPPKGKSPKPAAKAPSPKPPSPKPAPKPAPKAAGSAKGKKAATPKVPKALSIDANFALASGKRTPKAKSPGD